MADTSLLYGVPTIYHRLLSVHAAAERHERTTWGVTAASLRLAVSGSAALPVVLGSAWADLAGELPLERYGMSETGMILGNPLDGPRVAGHVGFPLPDVEVRLDEAGQVLVRSPGLFSGYYGQPEETAACFTTDGFFATGDTAERDEAAHGGSFRLLGRTSVDILKSNGYKISALDIENVLLAFEPVAECAVIGEEDAAKGQRIVAVVAFTDPAAAGEASALAALEDHARAHLLPYQVPHVWKIVPSLTRNALGKVNKQELGRSVVEGRGT
jgi:malonyl-CoA/methylmalonyl-CoA synthetase